MVSTRSGQARRRLRRVVSEEGDESEDAAARRQQDAGRGTNSASNGQDNVTPAAALVPEASERMSTSDESVTVDVFGSDRNEDGTFPACQVLPDQLPPRLYRSSFVDWSGGDALTEADPGTLAEISTRDDDDDDDDDADLARRWPGGASDTADDAAAVQRLLSDTGEWVRMQLGPTLPLACSYLPNHPTARLGRLERRASGKWMLVFDAGSSDGDADDAAAYVLQPSKRTRQHCRWLKLTRRIDDVSGQVAGARNTTLLPHAVLRNHVVLNEGASLSAVPLARHLSNDGE
eukprot:ctg_393.g203